MSTRHTQGRLTAGSAQPLILGPTIGVGGEGTVYGVASDTTLVAKLYNSALPKDKEQKLRAMIGAGTSELSSITAWPRDLILRDGRVVGFLMPKAANAEEAHVLYGPKSRKQKFPNAGYRFLVHVAMNIARAFVIVHKHGIVIGDINEKVALVERSGKVRLIDCDSFQITVGQHTYLCEVGVPIFTPPELHGLPSFRGLHRTDQHDLFGLAVLIFHLLFFGRHPFSGRHQTKPDMTLETAIRECRFAYAPDRDRTMMSQPPNTAGLSATTGPIARLFEAAFSPAAAQGSAKRPSASQWADALHELLQRLTTCKNNAAHAYASALSACPWCAMEMTSRVELFNYVQPQDVSLQKLDIDAIWHAIDGLKAAALQPPSDYVAAAASGMRPSPEAIVLHEASAAKDKLARAVAARVAAERAVAAGEKRREDAAGAAKEADHSVLAYDQDVARLADLRAAARYARTRLVQLAFASNSLLWLIVPIAGVNAYIVQQMNLALAGFGVPFMAWLISHYFRDRQHEVTIALAREIEGLRVSVDLGVSHRQRQAALRQAELKAAKEDLTQRQGALYQVMMQEREATAGLVRDDHILAAETAIKARQQAAQQAHDAALVRCQAMAREMAQITVKWQEHKDEAQRVCWVIRKLESRRASEYGTARAEAREQQLTDHLDDFFIAHEKWKGVPKAALSALASFGIETAADIEHDAVIKVPGFGAVRTKTLVDWRRQKEASFRFNPKKSDQSRRVQAVDRRMDSERQTHERTLGKVKRQLDTIHGALEQRKAAVDQIMRQASDLFAKAQLDLQAMQGNKVVRPPVPNATQRTSPFKSPQQGRKGWWERVVRP